MIDGSDSSRIGYAQAVFDGRVETDKGDFDIQNSTKGDFFRSIVSNSRFNEEFDPHDITLATVVAALKSTSARVRMRAIITLSIKGNLSANDLISASLMKNDTGDYDYLVGQTYGPSRFCPTVKHCAELFLPIIYYKSPSGIIELISFVSQLQGNSLKQVMDILTECGIVNVAMALAITDNLPIDSLRQSSVIIRGKVPEIPQLLTIYLDNPTQYHSEVVRFLASKSSKYLEQFLTTLFDSGEKAIPWLLESLPYQINKHFCLKVAKKCGDASIAWCIKGLSSAAKQTRLACAYALSQTAGNSQEVALALNKASEQETGWFTRREMRSYSKKIGA
jgi:hypothetical protein